MIDSRRKFWSASRERRLFRAFFCCCEFLSPFHDAVLSSPHVHQLNDEDWARPAFIHAGSLRSANVRCVLARAAACPPRPSRPRLGYSMLNGRGHVGHRVDAYLAETTRGVVRRSFGMATRAAGRRLLHGRIRSDRPVSRDHPAELSGGCDTDGKPPAIFERLKGFGHGCTEPCIGGSNRHCCRRCGTAGCSRWRNACRETICGFSPITDYGRRQATNMATGCS